jgi:glutamate--cysteine ligase
MPKGRYEIMLRHMPRVGTMGLDMMLRTCTIQTNLDYSSEADMAQKFRVAWRCSRWPPRFCQFAVPGRQAQRLLSYRSHIWSDTDPARTGMLPFVFEDGFGYERYVDYMLDVPMYFVFRDGKYIDAAGQSFRDFLDGKLGPARRTAARKRLGRPPLHRLPRSAPESFLEMRGADGGPTDRICALPALWVGLLYDQSALDAAWDLVKDWDMEGREALRASVPKLALDAPLPGGGTLRDIARAYWTSPARACVPVPRRTRSVTMRPASSPRSTRWWPPARFRPSACSTSTMASGTATCRASMM